MKEELVKIIKDTDTGELKWVFNVDEKDMADVNALLDLLKAHILEGWNITHLGYKVKREECKS